MAKTTRMLSVVALLMAAAAIALVAMAEDAGSGGAWKDSVKDKAGSAADGAKSWKDWAVGKWKGNGDKKVGTATPSTTEKVGETKENVMRMASEAQDKASEGAKMAEDHAKAGLKSGASEL